jgi:hypothetical protein
MVRVVMDNPNNALLRSLNEGMFPPFDPYNNRQDVIRCGLPGTPSQQLTALACCAANADTGANRHGSNCQTLKVQSVMLLAALLTLPSTAAWPQWV